MGIFTPIYGKGKFLEKIGFLSINKKKVLHEREGKGYYRIDLIHPVGEMSGYSRDKRQWKRYVL